MEKPFVQLDLETTGTDTVKDRIVQIACQKFGADMQPIDPLRDMLINPLMPIPAGATAVHGITNEMVAERPTFAHFAKSMFAYMKGSNVAGYNIRTFDVPLLAEEFARCGIRWPEPGTCFFDSYKIFQYQEPRDLAGALKFYTGEAIEKAHDAAGDVSTAMKVLRAQFKLYPAMADMTDEQLDLMCTNGVRCLDLSGKIILNEQGAAVYSFGKDKGKVVADFPGFGEWMLKNDFATDTKDVVRSIIHKGKKLF